MLAFLRCRYYMMINKSNLKKVAERLYILSLLTALITGFIPYGNSFAAEITPVKKKVVILYSFNQDYPIHAQFTQGIKNYMSQQSHLNVNYSYDSLDLPAHAQEKSYQDDLAQFLKQKYVYNPPDLIILQSKPATDFMLKYGKIAFGDIPVIVVAADQNGFEPAAFPSNYTAVFGAFDIKKAAQLILDNRPATSKIYIVLGQSAVEKKVQANFSEQLASFNPNIEFIYLSNLTFPQMLDSLKNIKGNAAILYTYTYSDSLGNTLVPAKALPTISAEASVPVYGILDTYFGTGTVGGYMVSWEVLGQRTAEVAGKILQGKQVGEIPVETYEAVTYKFDWRSLKRWGIAESKLPSGSIIEYKTLTDWEAHRAVILGGIALMLVEAVLIVQFLINWLRRKKAEKALLQLNAELEHKVAARTCELQDINAALEEEIYERQAVQEDLQESRDALIVSENQLKHYADELSASNKELKSFANIIAHDFRAPMVNMKGFSKELGYALDDLKQIIHTKLSYFTESEQKQLEELLANDVADALKFINSSVDKLDRMITALLNLARAGRREMIYKEVDMTELVKAVLQTFQHEIEKKGIRVEIDALPIIESDYLAMEQILGNLLDNAIKYLEPVRIGEIGIYSVDNGVEYQFIVQDNGRGISPIDCEKIFEIFHRAGNQNLPGEGMGLAFVKTLLRQLSGRVWCESTLGAGTKINFTVPKRQA